MLELDALRRRHRKPACFPGENLTIEKIRTMHYIESRTDEKKWISGVFKDQAKADGYFHTIPSSDDQIHSLMSAPFPGFPIYVIADGNFQFANMRGVKRKVLGLELSDDDDYVYFQVYRLEEDLAPAEPGTDCFNGLDVINVDNAYVEKYKGAGRTQPPFAVK